MTSLECDFVLLGWTVASLGRASRMKAQVRPAEERAASVAFPPLKKAPHFNMQHLCRESRPKWLLLRGRRRNLLKPGAGAFSEVLHRC